MSGNKSNNMITFKKIVIFGGSFSPPHIGHLGDIRAALRFFSCDELWVMPSADRRDKTMSASAQDRLAMTRLMIESLPRKMRSRVKISKLEINRPRVTRTYETIKELARRYPTTHFYFLIGADSLLTMPRWYRGKELYRLGNFLIISRAGCPLAQRYPKNIIFLKKYRPGRRASEASSTMIRERVFKNLLISLWVSKKVAEYITKNGL